MLSDYSPEMNQLPEAVPFLWHFLQLALIVSCVALTVLLVVSLIADNEDRAYTRDAILASMKASLLRASCASQAAQTTLLRTVDYRAEAEVAQLLRADTGISVPVRKSAFR